MVLNWVVDRMVTRVDILDRKVRGEEGLIGRNSFLEGSERIKEKCVCLCNVSQVNSYSVTDQSICLKGS